MKGKVVRIILILALLIAALLVNPMDLYRKAAAEKGLLSIKTNYLHLQKGEEITGTQYLGGNVYWVETNQSTYLIRKVRRSSSHHEHQIFQYESSVSKIE